MHLMVATPCFGGLVTQRYMQSVCGLLDYGRRCGLPISVELLGYDSLIPRARNTLVATFLDKPDATHLLFVDSDIGFAPEAVDRMLAFDEDLVAGMYPLKVVHYDDGVLARLRAGEDLQTAQLRYVGLIDDGPQAQNREGFALGIYAGTGFMMIRRRAFKQLITAYPETAYVSSHNAAHPNVSPNQYALFDTTIEPQSREFLSEDYTFCHRWRAIGGRLWLDTESRLVHTGPREFSGDAATRFADAISVLNGPYRLSADS